MSVLVYQPSDGQTAPMLMMALPWRRHGYRARLVIILSASWRVWGWRAVVV